MTTDKLTVDCSTGAEQIVPLTDAERAERQAQEAEAAADNLLRGVEEGNRLTIEDRVRTVDMPAEDAIAAATAMSVTGSTVAEVRNSAQTTIRELQRQVKDLARANRRLSRMVLRLLDGTD